MQQIHLLSLPGLAPGEEPLVTQAPSMSISSSATSCVSRACPQTVVVAPALAGRNDASSNASFTIPPHALEEISVDEAVGVLAMRWKINPYQAASASGGTTVEGSVEFPPVPWNVSVTSLSVTVNGRERSVANLSTPLRIALALAPAATSRAIAPAESVELVCSSSDAGLEKVAPCNTATGAAAPSIVCPSTLGDVRVNVSCPSVVDVPACQYFSVPLDAWSTAGCEAIEVAEDGTSVTCTCDHLT